MKTMYIYLLGLSILQIFSACGGNENSNVTAPQTGNTVCVENAKTTLNGVDYICQNDRLVPVQNNQPNCLMGSTMIDAQGNSYICQNNDWVLVKPISSSSSYYSQSFPSSSSVSYYNPSSVAQNYSSSSILGYSSSVDGSKESGNIKYGILTDVRDGRTYKTATIGSQTWMTENLNYDFGKNTNMGTYAWSGCYNNELDSCAKYGRLYTWEIAMNNVKCAYLKECSPDEMIQGICPSGWHLPSVDEFKILGNFIGDARFDGKRLKSENGWNGNGNGSNTYGFSALPAGIRRFFDGVEFDLIGDYALFWSTSEDGRYSARAFELRGEQDGWGLGSVYKNTAISVRCVKD